MVSSAFATEQVSLAEEPSKIIELSEVSDHLGFDDIHDLRTYFRTNGTAACYGLSPTGSVIARMRLFTETKDARECERCGGSEEYKRPGSGFEDDRGHSVSAELLAAMKKLAMEHPELPAAPSGTRRCRDCNGAGYVVDVPSRAKRSQSCRLIDKRLRRIGVESRAWLPVYAADEWRANPTGSSKPEGSGRTHMMAESDVALLGRVSKRLDYVRQHEGNVPARTSLERFLSEGSNGLISLWDLTPAGKVLLRKRKGAIVAEKFFQNERVDQQAKKDRERAELFEAADFQAREALKVGYRLYNRAKAQ